MTESGVTPPGNSIWTPFISQRDWELTRWAKAHRVTSSAFSDLLGIPEVRADNLSKYCSANMNYRSLSALNYPTIP